MTVIVGEELRAFVLYCWCNLLNVHSKYLYKPLEGNECGVVPTAHRFPLSYRCRFNRTFFNTSSAFSKFLCVQLSTLALRIHCKNFTSLIIETVKI
jgi:hypothetical protein